MSSVKTGIIATRRRRIPMYLAVLCAASLSLTGEGFSVRRGNPLHSGTSTTHAFFSRTALAAATDNKQADTNVQGDESKRRPAPNKRTALRWIVESVERLGTGEHEFSLDRPSAQLLEALQRLQRARTQREVAEAGRWLESLNITRTESVDVQERVIKVAAMSGLLKLALELLDGFLVERAVLPSSMAYVGVCNALRQGGRVRKLEQLLYRLGTVAEEEPVSVVALNTYLAVLCRDIEDASRLEHARDWLRPGVSNERLGGTEPDVASYATVLHAAATMENHRMVDDLWEEMTEIRKLQPTVYAHNALLRSARSSSEGDDKVLEVLDRLTEEVEPDRYTIDLVLVPLIRADRMGDIAALVGNFVENPSVDHRTVSNAFSAFLNTLIKAGELATAQALFDTYVMPSLSASDDETKFVRSTVRHFNVLIDGYRREVESSRAAVDEQDTHEETSTESQTDDHTAHEIHEARKNGHVLYETMVEVGLMPDGYTLTSMMGLSSTPSEVTALLQNALFDYGVEMTPAVVRAAMIAYGNVGDVSSACVLFDEFSAGTMNVRTWNALLSALAKGANLDMSHEIKIDSSTAAVGLVQSPVTNIYERGVCKLVNGQTCFDGIRRVVITMEQNGDEAINITRAPRPNSQTYCLSASALQHGSSNSEKAMELYRNATKLNLPGDGRFINALFRCFGDDIDGALSAWKSEIRRSCLAHEHRRRHTPPSTRRAKGKNLIASYHGLLYVCGRALRPDIAVRLVYAMNKEGIEPDEVAWNCYHSGKRQRQKLAQLDNDMEEKAGIGLAVSRQFESILQVECMKFDKNDKRRAGERRVRIIL